MRLFRELSLKNFAWSLLLAGVFCLMQINAEARSGGGSGDSDGGGEGRQRRSGGMDSGGGSRCEADLKLTLHTVGIQLEHYKIELPKDLSPNSLAPEWDNLKVNVTEDLIRSADSPEWKFAWSDRAKNTIELFCFEDDSTRGWFALPNRLKKVLVLHEVLWWKHAIQDDDFNVSPRIIANLEAAIALDINTDPSRSFVVTSSFYYELSAQLVSPDTREIYFANIRDVWTALEGAFTKIQKEQIPPMQFKSARVNGKTVEYVWTYYEEFRTSPHTSDDCTITLNFSKNVETYRIFDVAAKETCVKFDAHED